MSFRLGNIDGRAVLVDGLGYHDVASLTNGEIGPDPMDAVANGARLAELAASLPDEPTGLIADATLSAPVPRPPQVFGVGLNYRNHAEESGMALPTQPLVFTKFPSSIAAPDSDIEMRSDWCDYEGELVAVIGTGGKDIPIESAWDHVVGLCVGQDVSDRATQMISHPPQFSLGKSFDTFSPIGPLLVAPSALDDPAAMQMTVTVNGDVRQDDSTGDLIFDIPTLVSYLSHICTLQPGDVIFTGTPGGVGMAGAGFLRDGDVVTTSIDGLGSITNRCRRVGDHPYTDDIPEFFKRRRRSDD